MLVEGLIVSAMLALFLACVVLFHALYSARLASVREARAAAWANALGGCGGGIAAGLLNTIGTVTVLTEADEAGLIDSPDWLTGLGRGVGQPAQRSVQASPMLGGGTYNLSARASVACNDFADHADGDSFFATAFDAIRRLVVD